MTLDGTPSAPTRPGTMRRATRRGRPGAPIRIPWVVAANSQDSGSSACRRTHELDAGGRRRPGADASPECLRRKCCRAASFRRDAVSEPWPLPSDTGDSILLGQVAIGMAHMGQIPECSGSSVPPQARNRIPARAQAREPTTPESTQQDDVLAGEHVIGVCKCQLAEPTVSLLRRLGRPYGWTQLHRVLMAESRTFDPAMPGGMPGRSIHTCESAIPAPAPDARTRSGRHRPML